MATWNRRLKRWISRFFAPFAIAAAGGLGTGAALLANQGSGSAGYVWPQALEVPSPAHIWPWYHQGRYTNSSDTCGFDSRKDPINIVFQGAAGHWFDVRGHASVADHGGWFVNGGSSQYFLDHGQCEPMDDASASEGPLTPVDRWHMRYNQGPEYDPDWGWYTVAAAHHEDFVWTCPGHAVDGNEDEPPGGFNDARVEVWWNWIMEADDGHVKTWQEDWDNEQRFKQCDGDYAWSNGWVYHIDMPSWSPSGDGGGSWGWGNVYSAGCLS